MHAASPASVTAPPLSALGLACERGSRRLFSDLAFELHAGEMLWVRGRNGRGKTSLLRLVAGLGSAAQGQLCFDGRAARPARRRVVYIGHANALKEDASVLESLAFLLRIHGGRNDAAALAAALAHWGLLAQQHALVRTLSQGQRRRVALARLAIERQPALWVLDEPYDALDANGIDCLNDLLGAHLQRGGSVLITGHQAALAAGLPRRELDLDDCAA
ncbi:MAG TPA: cytochrome c biogenesis heme-transporting ATPase CcmA [Burkholderiaceae bacterium]|nr:cytochrome c biogenesis heme-transporting ATPase CcmA [Burkholderiaceae bacterium]